MSRTDTMQAIIDNMGLLKRGMHGHFQHDFDAIGISPAQLEMLKTIRMHEPISHKALARQSNLTPGAVSQLLDGLDRANCIVRMPSPSDRRISYISVSQTGKQTLQSLYKTRQQILTKIFTSLDDDELNSYLRVQQKILSWIETNRPITTKSKEKIQ